MTYKETRYLNIKSAVEYALVKIGHEKFRKTSMFLSNKVAKSKINQKDF